MWDDLAYWGITRDDAALGRIRAEAELIEPLFSQWVEAKVQIDGRPVSYLQGLLFLVGCGATLEIADCAIQKALWSSGRVQLTLDGLAPANYPRSLATETPVAR
jgi:hypothetical protein